jgi:3-methyladenine DNA glycosylase AlkC
MTKRFSAEFAVRTFINADLKAALRHIRQWSESDNYHVRRLASEGARPRLPCAEQIPALIANPEPMLPVLQLLRDDPSEYVRRSVANHLNDIAKDHPELLETLLPEWLEEAPLERGRLLRHACRTLIKNGNPAVLQAFGFTPAKIVRRHLALEVFTLSSHSPRVGDKITLNLRLCSTHKKPQQLVVDYVVHWRRANGQWSPKVFKWRNIELQPGEILELTKSHSFQKVTTRTYYPGAHQVALQINGCLIARLDFDLLE